MKVKELIEMLGQFNPEHKVGYIVEMYSERYKEATICREYTGVDPICDDNDEHFVYFTPDQGNPEKYVSTTGVCK